MAGGCQSLLKVAERFWPLPAIVHCRCFPYESNDENIFQRKNILRRNKQNLKVMLYTTFLSHSYFTILKW
jgi:hypothetical protein